MTANGICQVAVDEDSERFLCSVRDGEQRRRITSAIRRLAPDARVQLIGGHLSLDLRTALRLRASKHQLPLEWTEEAARAIDAFTANYVGIGRARRRVEELQDIGAAKKALGGYERLGILDDHQIIAIAAMTDSAIKGLCLFDEQGAGKTIMTMHSFDVLRRRGSKYTMVIFAPKNMVQEWAKEFRRFFGSEYVVRTVMGSRAEKYDSLHENADVYVTNYETAQLLEGSLRSLLHQHLGRAVMVVDESFLVKNQRAKRSRAVRRLRYQCDRCWVLCGTPAPNHALDVVHQFDIADGGVTFAGTSFPEGPQELRDTIQRCVEQRGIYLRRLKSDVLPNLPIKQFERVSVPMEDDQRNLYGEALKGLVKDLEATNERHYKRKLTSFLARRMALFQLCSHPGQLLPSYHSTPGKLLALDGIIEELVGQRREKVVIWSFFRYSLRQIVQRYKRFNPVQVDGAISDTQARSEAIGRFQEDAETMIFVGNPAAAGAGITLTRARTAIYESFSIQAAHYLQSLDRIHRRGQTRDVNYYMLLCQNSIEEDEYERLLRKERAARELFSDNDPLPRNRDVLLGELLSALRKL
jgi:SNF2 family DNA or RNA helicase